MKALLLISSGVFGALSIWFVASAVLQPLKVEWGFSDVEGSFLTSVVNLGFCFGCFFSALLNLADVFSAPALILVGGLSAAVANASLLLVRGFWGALLMRCLVGLGLSLVYPPSVKLLSTWYSADKRSAAMGVMISFFCIGTVLCFWGTPCRSAIWICICLLWGLTALADSPNYSALVTLHAEQSNVGTAVTVQLFCGYLATILALWLVPMLSAAWSWRWSLASLSLGPALSVLALLLLRPRAKDVDEGSIKGPASSDAP